MCKLFAIVEIENQKNAELFAKKAIPIVTKSDNHGLGIMRLGERGVSIQRWLEPPKVLRAKKSAALFKYEKALRHQQNAEGVSSEKLYAIAIHGRFATCEKSLANTHPFYKGGAALMHNGIITNADKFTRTLSTCDSEALLSQYLEHDVKKDARNLTKSLDGVGGYYAAIVFNDNGIIDIWRDETATLFLAHVRGVGVVIATTAEIIVQTAKRCKAYITGIDEVLPGVTIRWTRGVYPRISTFEGRKPAYISTVGQPDLVQEYKEDYKAALSSDTPSEHWWNEELKDAEAQRVAKWQAEEDADQQRLRNLCGTDKGE
jgi:predicted glutamine amidotransferase